MRTFNRRKRVSQRCARVAISQGSMRVIVHLVFHCGGNVLTDGRFAASWLADDEEDEEDKDEAAKNPADDGGGRVTGSATAV